VYWNITCQHTRIGNTEVITEHSYQNCCVMHTFFNVFVLTVGCDISVWPGWWLPFSWAYWDQYQRNSPSDWKPTHSRIWRVPSTLWAPATWCVTVTSCAALCSESVGFPFCIPTTARLPSGEYVTEHLVLLALFGGTDWTMSDCVGSASFPLRRNLILQCHCQQHHHQWQVQRQQHLITFMSFLRHERYWKSFSNAPLHHQGRRPFLLQLTSRWVMFWRLKSIWYPSFETLWDAWLNKLIISSTSDWGSKS